MTNVVQFTAISGTKNEDALCYILEFDDARILLDCGCYENYTGDSLVQLRRVARQVDVVLLSHPDMAHLGAYPLAYGKYGLNCPAFATVPVRNMGRLCMLDVVRSLRAREDFDLYSESDVKDAFENITPLRYSQPTALPGNHSDITITAYSAGHTVGGTIWTIRKGTEQVMYAMDYNHVKEAHLNKTDLLPGRQGQVAKPLTRPMLLITDAYNARYNLTTRTKRVNCFFDTIDAVTQKGGNVLIPVDSAARVLEIAYILENRWVEKKMHRNTHPLYLLGRYARQTAQFAQSMLEWMSESVTNQFTGSKTNPFEFQNMVVVQSIAELDAQMSAVYDNQKPKSRHHPKGAVVLSTLEGMSLGYSQELFLRWAEDPKNTIILTQRGSPTSLTHELFRRWWPQAQADLQPDEPLRLVEPVRLENSEIKVVVKQRIPLKDQELEDWRKQEADRKEREAAREAMMKRGRTMLDNDDDDDSSSNDGSDNEDERGQGMSNGLKLSTTTASARDMGSEQFAEIDLELERLRSGQTFDLYVRDRGRVGGFYRQPQSYCMFPFQEKRRRIDEYGEVFDPKLYTREFDQHGDEILPGSKHFDPYGNPLEGQAKDNNANSLGNYFGMFGTEDDIDSDNIDDDVPTKILKETRRVIVKSRISFVDLDGRSDGRSVRNILVQIEPKRLILAHGSAEGTNALAEYFRDPEVPITKEIYTPSIGEIVNVSSGANTYTVKLTDALLSRVRLEHVKDCMVGFVSGRIHYAEDSEVPVLDVETKSLENPWCKRIMIGDTKLSLLKHVLADSGIRTEFSADGVLVCNGVVAVRRGKDNSIKIQGHLSPEYYKIRSLVYKQLAIL